MARPTKQRPPVKQETEEMEAQEMGETPEEETREGTEDGASMPNSRKRSPKGAKNTKAPMDADCGTCKSGKPCSCKAKKDGGCGSYGKRGDALTPQEYLAACDLGIQDRSRPYIRARLDAAERLDLKCGKGSISKGEKCTKGAASQVTAVHNSGRPLSNRQVRQIERGILVQEATTGKKVKMSKEQAALLIGTPGTQSRKFVAASLRPVKSKNLKAGLKSVQTSNDPMDRAVSRVARRELFNRRVQTGVRVLGGALALSGIAASAGGRRDSPYASGFPLDSAALAI